MPVPASQVTKLQADVKSHEEKIERIEGELRRPHPMAMERRLRRELRRHRTVVKMGRDPQLIPALDELVDSPAVRSQAMADPAAYARRKGVALPHNTRVTMREFSPRFSVEASVDLDGLKVTVGYDSDSGFYGDVAK